MHALKLLEDFRAERGEEKTLFDLETCLKSKLPIAKRLAKRAVTREATIRPLVLQRCIAEVRGERFAVMVRRAAMPKMSPFA